MIGRLSWWPTSVGRQGMRRVILLNEYPELSERASQDA